MKASEYILKLQTLVEQEGDLEVKCIGGNFNVITALSPEVRHMKILKGRESKSSFAYSFDPPERFGDKVISI